jgi:hypothetical protein
VVRIKRLYRGSDATIGALSIDGVPFCWTLEPPWQGNAQRFSCIPVGHYIMKQWHSPRFKIDTFKVYDLEGREVAGRSGIILHSGNTEADTEGCILPGLAVGKLGGRKAVLQSRVAFEQLMKEIGDLLEMDLIIT